MVELLSARGGHSGEFCGHAFDSLSDVVQAYIDAGFQWVCHPAGTPLRVPPILPALSNALPIRCCSRELHGVTHSLVGHMWGCGFTGP